MQSTLYKYFLFSCQCILYIDAAHTVYTVYSAQCFLYHMRNEFVVSSARTLCEMNSLHFWPDRNLIRRGEYCTSIADLHLNLLTI